jgi:hypothetical protein
LGGSISSIKERRRSGPRLAPVLRRSISSMTEGHLEDGG